MSEKVETSASAPQVRTISSEEWTAVEYGERLFSMGGALFGSRTEMYRLATVMICLDVIAQDVSKVPCRLMRKTEQGAVVVRPEEHPVAALLQSGPNDFYGTPEFMRQAAYNLALESEYYIAGRENRRGDIIEFAGIPAGNVGEKHVNTQNRKWYYDINASTLHDMSVFGWAHGRRSFENCAHIRRRTFNGQDIVSNLNVSTNAVKLLSSMQSEQIDTFSNGGLPQMAFTFPNGLNDEQFQRLKSGFEVAMKEARKRRKPLVLEGSDGNIPGIEKLSVSATDMDFSRNAQSAAMDIVRYYRVPPHKVFLMDSVKYDNMDPAERIYVDDTLASYFMDIQEGLNRSLLSKKERETLFFEFDKEQAYAMAPLDRQKIFESRWKNGMITKNQMLQGIGHNQIGPEGDIYMMSGNFVITDKDNNVLMRAGGNSPDDEKPDDDDDDQTDEDKSSGNVIPLR